MSYRQQNNHDGLWWQIALGIFVGQLMTAGLAAVAAFALGFFALKGVSEALPNVQLDHPKPRYTTPRQQQFPRYEPPVPRALESGERCISHKRFQRVENGWVELINDPC